jgi:Tol biopolymer transport system component
MRGYALVAQPFDGQNLRLSGAATPIVEQLGDGRNYSVSNNGVLVFKRQPLSNQLLDTEFREGNARLSPDGRWIVYVSDESGQPEVYARSFTLNAAGTALELGGKFPI